MYLEIHDSCIFMHARDSTCVERLSWLCSVIAARRLNAWAATNETFVGGVKVYGRQPLQSFLVDLLVQQGEPQRSAATRVRTVLSRVPQL